VVEKMLALNENDYFVLCGENDVKQAQARLSLFRQGIAYREPPNAVQVNQ
jgi:hypothetical protein